MKKFAFLMLASLTLTACMSREQADERLARGCAAGVEIFLTNGYKIKTIKNKSFSDNAELGKGYRDVNLSAVETDGWAEVDKEYRCIFEEGNSLFGMSYIANIYQVKVNDQTYGKESDKILGNFQDHLKLTETVDHAMNKP